MLNMPYTLFVVILISCLLKFSTTIQHENKKLIIKSSTTIYQDPTAIIKCEKSNTNDYDKACAPISTIFLLTPAKNFF